MRHQRLEQRNNALANEFRDLKPEIGRAYNQLCNLVEKSGVLSETILNLLELLKTALPVKLTDADKKTLQNELHAIADNAVSKSARNTSGWGMTFVGMRAAYPSLRQHSGVWLRC